MAKNARFCFVNSKRIIHFGIKPVRGGNPPSDSRIRGIINKRAGVLNQEVERVLRVVD